MFADQVTARDIWIAITTSILGFTAGYATYSGIMEASNVDKVARGSYILKTDLDRDYIRRDAIAESYTATAEISKSYIPRREVESRYIPRAECPVEKNTSETNSVEGPPPPPASSTTPANQKATDAVSVADSFIPQDLAVTTKSYRLRIVSAKKVVDTITLVVEVGSVLQESVKFGIDYPPYLLDQNGERWNYKNDTSGIVSNWNSPTELPAGSHFTTQIRFEARGANTGTVFTLVARERAPKSQRPIVINGIRLE